VDKNIIDVENYPPSDEFLLLLAKTYVEDIHGIEEKSEIITVEQKEPISSAFKKLIKHNLLAVPLILQDGSYYGFLEILDIIAWIVNLLGEHVLTKEDVDIEKLEAFKSATVKQVMTYPISKKSIFRPFKLKTSLLSAMEELARGIHRIPVVDDEGKLVNIITQGSILKFIQKNMSLLGAKKEMKLFSMYFKSTQYVMSLSHHEKAIEAFRLLGITKVGAVAIVDDDGKLIGNCSARDLKRSASTLSHQFIARLFKPLSQYLGDQELVTATPNDTLELVIKRVVEKNIHRIYVLDEEKKPQGLFSLSDILEELLRRE